MTGRSQCRPVRRRKTAGKRWSASSTIEWIGGRGTPLCRTATSGDAPRDVVQQAVKVKVHYRLDGRSRKATLRAGTPADLIDQAGTFQALLHAAYVNNWPADANFRPLPPVPLPAGPTAVGTAVPALVGLPTVAGPVPADVASIAAWYLARQESTKKKRGGGDRIGSTVRDYRNHVEFFLEFARYAEDDPRRVALGLAVGAPLRLDDAATGLSERDLLDYVALRAATNLRTRGVNERRIARWAAAAEVEEARACAQEREPALPPMPRLDDERSSARTLEAHARTISAMLRTAHDHGLIPYLPWTAVVADEVPNAGATSYTARLLPSRTQLAAIMAAISRAERRVQGPELTRCTATGERYAAMVWLAGREAPRPEETIAIRDSWVILDDDPRIELQWAEVFSSLPGTRGRERVRVPLKQRAPGEIRVIRPDPADRDEFVRILTHHRARFVDPARSQRVGEDPYFFTNHMGQPVDLGNFGDWWKQALATVRVSDHSAALANLPFRRLRAAAITDWLIVRGYTTEQAAMKAGNSQAMIERHYKGVLEQRPRPVPGAPMTVGRSTDLAAFLRELPTEELTSLLLGAQQESATRLNQLAAERLT